MVQSPGRRRRRRPEVEVQAMEPSSTDFYPSQLGGETVINYCYTDMPWRLLLKDAYYFFVYSWALPRILLPLRSQGSGGLDELYPSWSNFTCIFLHAILFLLQFGFLASLPFAAFFPIWIAVGGIACFLLLNRLLCGLLNGRSHVYRSDPEYAPERPEHAHEQWIFLNGVVAGEAWTKASLNRLALTFGRPVLGIHNRTSGFLFDIIECLVQRNFAYATVDVRLCFRIVRDVLYDPAKSRVVFVLHSQGGIEGSLVLDWLLQELPQDLLSKLEVYTFGNAANHFNNPHRRLYSQRLVASDPLTAIRTIIAESRLGRLAGGAGTVDLAAHAVLERLAERDATLPSGPPKDLSAMLVRASSAAKDRTVGHIEHYAHSTDFVAVWGVLHFATNRIGSPQLPRFLGRLFNRSTGAGGHLFVQHYMDGMFPLRRDPQSGALAGADEDNAFMRETIKLGDEDGPMKTARESLGISYAGTRCLDVSEDVQPWQAAAEALRSAARDGKAMSDDVKVGDLSRLWAYRNGRSPSATSPPP